MPNILHNLSFIHLSSYTNLYSTSCLTNRINRVVVASSDGRFTFIFSEDSEYCEDKSNGIRIKQKHLRIAPELSDLSVLSFDIFGRLDNLVMVVCVTRENEVEQTNEIQFYSLTSEIVENGATCVDDMSSVIRDKEDDKLSGSNEKLSYFSFTRKEDFNKTQSVDWLFPFLTFNLDYAPFAIIKGRKLNGSIIFSNDLYQDEFTNNTNFLMISGSDGRLHSYSDQSGGRWFECDTKKAFPPSECIPKGVIISMDFLTTQSHEAQLAAFGLVANALVLIAYKKTNQEVIFSETISVLSMVTSVKLSLSDGSKNLVNLVFVSQLGGALLFKNIDIAEILKIKKLPPPIRIVPQSCVEIFTIATFYDADLDGNSEVVIGTHDGRLAIFKLDSIGDQNNLIKLKDAMYIHTAANGPVMAIKILDVTNDGLNELIVVSPDGINILQLDLEFAIDVIRKRITEDDKHS